jgi:NADH:ubiquinone oxidoreductase subunit 5 (subunit L)/multisubunit Na+/H+ antiporter MnhA subunit
LMAILKEVASLHLLMWIVPASVAILVSALGARLSRRSLAVISLLGLAVPLLQSVAAVVFFLWGWHYGQLNEVRIETMTGRLFTLSFLLTQKGAWAILLSTTVAMAAQIHALGSVSRLVGRHRYHALVLAVAASGSVLFTGRSMVTVLFGWETLVLAGAFMAGFWESEEGAGRTGMRWLLFQRASGVLLLLGFLALDLYEHMGAVFIVLAVCVRAGQLPFHGWIPDSTRAPASTTILVHGVSSLLAAVYVLDLFWELVVQTPHLADVVGIVGAAGVLLGILTGLQQHRPQKTLGWMYMLMGGLAWIGFSIGDPVAARMLVTGTVLSLGGLVLSVGSVAGPLAEAESTCGVVKSRYTRRAYLVLAAAVALPPSITFVALARLCGSVPEGSVGLLACILVCLALFAMGWILRRIHHGLDDGNQADQPRVSRWRSAAPAGLGVIALALGAAAFFTHMDSPTLYGGVGGILWATGSALSLLAGWLLGAWLLRPRLRRWTGRLTETQRMMDRVAGTGLGIGEMMVQLPVMVLRAAGVILWRGIGDFLLDTLILGTAVRTVEGIGVALRYFQNGRIQRYTFVIALATLLLVLMMLR